MNNLPSYSLVILSEIGEEKNRIIKKYTSVRVENLNSAKVNFNLISTSDLLRSARHQVLLKYPSSSEATDCKASFEFGRTRQ